MDETTNPDSGVEGTAAPDVDERPTDAPDELDGATDEQSDGAAPAEPDPDAEEVEEGGKKWVVPKGWRDGRLMHEDYTRKTQGLAEGRKAVEAREAAAHQLGALNESYLNDLADMRAAHKEEARYQAVDWVAWGNQDPAAAQAAFFQYQKAKTDREQISARVNHQASQLHQQRGLYQQQEAAKREQDLAKRVQESEAALASDDKTWTQTRSAELVAYMQKQYGIDGEDFKSLISPKFVRLMRDAMTGRKALTTATAKPPPEPVKPVPVLRANSATKPGLHDGLSMDEWMRRHNSQNRKKA